MPEAPRGGGAFLRRAAPYALCAVCGAALGLVFDGALEAELSWFLLSPLFVLCRFRAPAEAARLGFAFALPMWFVSLRWMMALSGNGGPFALVLLGLFGLGAYCAAYTALFAAAASKAWRIAPPGAEFLPALAAALAWCGAEWLRATLFGGFAWNALGVTQAALLPAVQAASLGGVYAVSFLVAFMNSGAAGAAVRMWRNIRRPGSASRRNFDLMAALALLLAALAWGTRRAAALTRMAHGAPEFSVAAVNPEMPCVFEQDSTAVENAWAGLLEKSAAAAATRPDLLVWPETTLPFTLPDGARADEMAALADEFGAPVLAGGTEDLPGEDDYGVVHNSSFLFTTNGVAATYRKQRLVPFGEYIPFDKTLKFLRRFAPAGVSCTPGYGPVVMRAASGGGAGAPAAVSPLICFEDTVAALSRAAVRAGADILVAQSNDAWFKGSTEPWQHHRQALFRAVENARPLVRCSNSGVTALVDAAGRSTEDSAFFKRSAAVPRNAPATLYTRFGDWVFAIPCAVLLAAALAWPRRPQAAPDATQDAMQ